MTLATYYWFSQSPLYNETMLGDLPWHFWLRFLMLALAFLMISNVSYPAVPTVGYKKISEILGSLWWSQARSSESSFLRKQFYFPALVGYVLYGVAKTVFFGLIGRQPRGDVPVISDDDEDYCDPRPADHRWPTSTPDSDRPAGAEAPPPASRRAAARRTEHAAAFSGRSRRRRHDEAVSRFRSHHAAARASRSAGQGSRGRAALARVSTPCATCTSADTSSIETEADNATPRKKSVTRDVRASFSPIR